MNMKKTAIAASVAFFAASSPLMATTFIDNEQHKLDIGGFVQAQAFWHIYDEVDSDRQKSSVDHSMSQGSTRFNVGYTRKTSHGDIRYFFEQDIYNDSLRHASISWNGWVFGQTWSPFANLTALPNTIESGLTSITSTWAHRNIVAGRNIEVNDSLSVGVFLEDWGYDENTNRSVP